VANEGYMESELFYMRFHHTPESGKPVWAFCRSSDPKELSRGFS